MTQAGPVRAHFGIIPKKSRAGAGPSRPPDWWGVMWSDLKKAPPERGSGLGSFSGPCSGEAGPRDGSAGPEASGIGLNPIPVGGYEELETRTLKSHLIHTGRGALGRNWSGFSATRRRCIAGHLCSLKFERCRTRPRRTPAEISRRRPRGHNARESTQARFVRVTAGRAPKDREPRRRAGT